MKTIFPHNCRLGIIWLVLVWALVACADESSDSSKDTLTPDGDLSADVDVGEGDLDQIEGDQDLADLADGEDTTGNPDQDLQDLADGDQVSCLELGESCSQDSGCCSGFCVSTSDGLVCSPACTSSADCSEFAGTVCRSLTGRASELACRLPEITQCSECEQDSDCLEVGARCIQSGAQLVCVMPCEGTSDCEQHTPGSTCESINGSMLCQVPTGGCSCSDPDGDGYGSGLNCPKAGTDCAPYDETRNPDAEEVCDYLDNNCDGDIDEGFELDNDVENCGQCGRVCQAPEGTTAVCEAGECGVSDCPEGSGDCDLDPTTCETDFGTDVNNCGGCGNRCEFANGVGACVEGDCQFVECNPGFFDNDAQPGCEYSCVPQNPGPELCDYEDNNCDGQVDEGFNLNTSLEHCGVCNYACSLGANANIECDAGECQLSSCQGAYRDCDGDYYNGCETDTANDADHCGACGQECNLGPNTVSTCNAGSCVFVECVAGTLDCNNNLSDGCESNASDGSCACQPGTTQPCYTGPTGTEGEGLCVGGTQTCNGSGTGWGPCVGEVVPAMEICGNGVDEDCTGTADDVPDQDGDGWTRCDGDCCDSLADGCLEPALVNPGAYDFVGNSLDDNCDGTADNPSSAVCSSTNSLTGTTAADLAASMDICQSSGGGPLDSWGLVSANLYLADGSAAPEDIQTAVLNDFGAHVLPKANNNFGVLSSGTARRTTDTGFQDPNDNSLNVPTAAVSAPADYLSEHGGELEAHPNCQPGNSTVNDSAQLELRLKAPTNAQGFEFHFKFYSSEYPEWLCTQFNDFFLVQLDSGATGIPADKNISFDISGNPVSVNNAFFEVCQPISCGTCPGNLVCDGGECVAAVGDAGVPIWNQ